MTPEAQRIAIAEACPAAFRVIHDKVYWKNDDGLCDPLDDLNAMHEAENTLSDENYGKFVELLKGIYLAKTRGRTSEGCISATANQRADAFLRALGLWQDEDLTMTQARSKREGEA